MLYSTFYLGETQMAVPIPCILEIGRSFKFHPVRGAPEVIDGLINLRGKVVTIINLGLAFEEEKGLAGDGIHVDRISSVMRVENEELQAVPSNMAHPFYKHVVRRGDSFTIILEPSKILNLHENQDLLS